jgi:hypothetical protein
MKGIELMLKQKTAPQPAEDDKKPKATGKGESLFKDGPAEEPPAEAPPADAPPAATPAPAPAPEGAPAPSPTPAPQ